MRPRVLTVTLTNANQAYEVVIPRAVKKFEIQCRPDGNGDTTPLQLGFDAVEAMVDWYTIRSGGNWYADDVNLGEDLGVWLVSQTAGVVAEALLWPEVGNR